MTLPWIGRGWLLLLDWTSGPRPGAPLAAWGLGTPNPTLPFGLAVDVLQHLVGAQAATWLPVAVVLALAAWSASRLVAASTGGCSAGSTAGRLAAATVYAVNPLVFDRLWAGQVGYLLGYALLPLGVLAAVDACHGSRRATARAALLWLLMIAASTHFFWIFLPVAIACARRLVKPLLPAIALALSLGFVLIPVVAHATVSTAGQLAAYRTRGAGWAGALGNVATLYGFWRVGPELARQAVAAWPLVLAAIAVVAAAGWRSVPRPLARTVGASAVVGLLLAMGDRGPTGFVFAALYHHLPGFSIMREPQKFAALVALAYATFFGHGVAAVTAKARWLAVLLVLVPIGYTPTLLWGFGGRVSAVEYPASWAAASSAMGAGPGKVLFLPFELYQSLPFTGGRTVADLSRSYFRRPVVAGEDPDVGPPSSATSQESRFVSFVLGVGPQLTHLGRVLAPLGIQYVAVASHLDAFGWLTRQADLRPVLRQPDFALYAVEDAAPGGFTAPASRTVDDWGALVSLEDSLPSPTPIVVRHPAPGPVSLGSPAGVPAEGPAGVPSGVPAGGAVARRESPVRWRQTRAWSQVTVLPDAFQRGWPGQAFNGGVIGVRARPGTTAVQFSPWTAVRLLYVVSAAGFVLLLVLCDPRQLARTSLRSTAQHD